MVVRQMVAAGLGALLIGVLAPAQPTQAAAGLTIPDCPGNVAPRLVQGGLGPLESVTGDPRGGRLYLGGFAKREILRLDAPDAEPRVLVDNVDSPGGLAWQGNTLIAGLDVFLGLNPPDGAVTPVWAGSTSTNGLRVDKAGEWLYVNQSAPNSVVHRVKIADPSHVEVFARPPLLDTVAGFDGMEIDDRDRLYIATTGSGAALRVNRDGSICSLAKHPLLALGTMITLGTGGDFPTTSAYVVTLLGNLVELPHAVR